MILLLPSNVFRQKQLTTIELQFHDEKDGAPRDSLLSSDERCDEFVTSQDDTFVRERFKMYCTVENLYQRGCFLPPEWPGWVITYLYLVLVPYCKLTRFFNNCILEFKGTRVAVAMSCM